MAKHGNTGSEMSISAHSARLSHKIYYRMGRLNGNEDPSSSISQLMASSTWLLRETPTRAKQTALYKILVVEGFFHQQEMNGKAQGLIYVIIIEGEFRSEMAVSATCVNTHCESKKKKIEK